MKIIILEGSPNRQGSSHTLVKYLNFQDQGMVLGKGCGTPSMTAGSKYPQTAYKLGKSLI